MLLRSPLTLLRLLTLPLILLITGNAFSQETDPSIEELLAQRSVLIQTDQATYDVDNRLFDLGHRPKAVLSVQNLADGTIKMTCPLYRPYTAESVAQMEIRLKAHYPSLISLAKDTSLNIITAIFETGTTLYSMSEITTHFGYRGYETNN